MEGQSEALAREIEELKEKVADSEDKIKQQEEALEANRGARLTVEAKFDVAFLKRLNKYFEHNAEPPVVNLVNIFVGLLRNAKDVSRIDVELIFKTFASFNNKMRGLNPTLMSRDVLNYYAPQIALYKKFIREKDDPTKIVQFVDFDANFDRGTVDATEAARLVEEQRRVMGPWSYLLVWADAYQQQASKEVYKRKYKKMIADCHNKCEENQKAIDHNEIILENQRKHNIEQSLLDEQKRETDTNLLITNVLTNFDNVIAP